MLARQAAERAVLDHLSSTPAATDLVVTGDGAARVDVLHTARTVPGVAEAVGRSDQFLELDRATGFMQIRADPGVGGPREGTGHHR